jgi:hypothetical protein
MAVDLEMVPPFYRSWLRNALEGQRNDVALIQDLTSVRNEHAQVAEFQARLIESYEQNGLCNSRRSVVESAQISRDYCQRVVRVLDEALGNLRQFD